MEMLTEYTHHADAWRAEDLLKLLYQRYLGCGHFAPTEEQARARLLKEWAETPASDALPLVDDIGGGYARLHLAAAKAAGLHPESILKVFLASAKASDEATRLALRDTARSMNPTDYGVSVQDWHACLTRWEADGMPAVSHSEAYRKAYHPSYRVIESRYARWIPVLDYVEKRLLEKTPLTLAIEGRSGAGKSQLADRLVELYGASAAHMDDFFLPAERKTRMRLAQPGGNVDIERFASEVLIPLSKGKDIAYHPFSCRTDKLSPETVLFPQAPLRIVEGSYSLHPAGCFPYDVKIFLTIPGDVQRARILRRNGETMLRRFEQEWIPLEEKYFQAFDIPSHADVCFNSESGQFVSSGQDL